MNVYCKVGGAGATFGFVVLMAFMAKSKRYKTLGRLALPAAFCSINEPIVFGTPIILNPILFIPFVVIPVFSILFAYVLTILGIVPIPPGITTPIGTPVILQGLMQGDWRIAALQGVLCVFSLIGWYPFFKIIDKNALKDEEASENTAI